MLKREKKGEIMEAKARKTKTAFKMPRIANPLPVRPVWPQ